MKEFVSKITSAPYSSEQVFAKLSNLENLQPALARLDQLPPDLQSKLQDVRLTSDSVTAVTNMGEFCIRLAEKEPCKTLKFSPDNLPINANLWVQLLEKTPGTTHMRLTVKLDIPLMLRPLLGNKLDQLKPALDKAADMLANIAY